MARAKMEAELKKLENKRLLYFEFPERHERFSDEFEKFKKSNEPAELWIDLTYSSLIHIN